MKYRIFFLLVIVPFFLAECFAQETPESYYLSSKAKFAQKDYQGVIEDCNKAVELGSKAAKNMIKESCK